MNFGVSLSRNTILMMSTYVIITLCSASSDGTFCNFLVILNVKINCVRNYENLLNFVIVMLKILVVPLLGQRVVCSLLSDFIDSGNRKISSSSSNTNTSLTEDVVIVTLAFTSS